MFKRARHTTPYDAAQPAAPGGTDRARGSLQLLVDPVFGSFFWGKLVSASGMWIHGIVATILVYACTGSAFVAGLVSVAQFAPQLLLGPLSGTMADRGHTGRQILVGRILCASGSGLVTGLLLSRGTVEDDATAAAVIVGSILVGLGFVTGGPAMQSIVPHMVRPNELRAAMALNNMPMVVARIAGPALGATLALRVGYIGAFAVATVCQLVFIVILLLIELPSRPQAEPGTDLSVRAAVRYVRSNGPLVRILIATAAIGFGLEPSVTLAPALSDQLGGGAVLAGRLATASGVGSALGLVTLSWMGNRVRSIAVASIGLWLMVAGLAAVVALGTVSAALGGLALSGFGFSFTVTALGTLQQLRTPVHLRGRVTAFWFVAFLGSRPVGAMILGTTSDLFTSTVAVGLAAALLAATAVVCRPRRLRLESSG